MSPSNHFLPDIRTLPTGGLLFSLFPTRKASRNTRRLWAGGSKWAAYHLSPSQYDSFQKQDHYKLQEAWQPEKAVLLPWAQQQPQARKIRP